VPPKAVEQVFLSGTPGQAAGGLQEWTVEGLLGRPPVLPCREPPLDVAVVGVGGEDPHSSVPAAGPKGIADRRPFEQRDGPRPTFGCCPGDTQPDDPSADHQHVDVVILCHISA
jgi:hypothetical protein